MTAPQTEIIITLDGVEIARRTVTPGAYLIGRGTDADLLLETPLASRHHARLTVHPDEWLIEDLASANGTFINDQPVPPHAATRVFPTQTLRVGDATVALRRVRGSEAPEATLMPTVAVGRALLPEEVRVRRHAIGQVVAQGGMGAILSAQDQAIRRSVAMKVMLQSGGAGDLARFVEEARITGQLEHPNIVPVHELGVDEQDQFFYTMKFVRGITLKKVLELISTVEETARKYPLGALLTIFQKVCDAVAFAHAQGVIHRDLKPENIMLGDYGEVLVMDWGLAKRIKDEGRGEKDEGGRMNRAERTEWNEIAGRRPPEGQHRQVLANSLPRDCGAARRAGAEATGNDEEDGGRGGVDPQARSGDSSSFSSATLAGSIMGTPQYMAPEQARGEVETMDQRADIYALGAILYHILALRPSVTGGAAMAIVEKVARGEIDPLTAPASKSRPIPDSLAAVCRKAMALDPAERYPGVPALQAEIEAFQNGFATSAEKAGLGKQLVLLVRRNKGIATTAGVAWLILTALGVWFILSIKAGERRATHSADLARAAEKVATEKEEATRHALARAQISLAEAAYRGSNALEMRAALQDVPEDLRDADWSYLFTRSDASIATVRKGVEIWGVAAHPKMPGVFAVGGADGKITVLRARTGETLLEFAPAFSPQHQPGNHEYRLAFSPDGETLAIAHTGNGILLCSARDGKKLAEWDTHKTASLQFSPDGRLLLQQLTEHPVWGISLWEVPSGRELWTKWNPNDINLESAVFSSNGTEVICIRRLSYLVLSAKDGAQLREWTPRPELPFSRVLAAAPGGKMVVVAGHDGDVMGLSLADGTVLFRSRTYDNEPRHLAFLPGGKRFVAFTPMRDGRQLIQLWDAKSGKPLEALLGGGSEAHGLSVHPISGEMLITGKDSRLWNVAPPPEIWAGGRRSFAAQFWGSDDTLFASKSEGQTAAELWDIRADKQVWVPEDRKQHENVNVSADGRFAAIPGSPLLILEWKNGKPQVVSTAQAVNFRAIVRLSPDGARLVTRDERKTAYEVRESLTGRKIVELRNEGVQRMNDIAWVAGGTRLVGLATMRASRGSPGSEERLILWDAATGRQLLSVPNSTAMDVLAVAPGGLAVAEAGADKLVRVRDAATFAVQHQFRVHDDRITTLAWHPTRPMLATGSADFTAKIWNIETGRSVEEFHGLANVPITMSFSPGGTRLACAVSEDGTHVWEPAALRASP